MVDYNAMDQSSYGTPQPPRKSWFGRNWLWFMPLVIGGPLLLACACCGGGIVLAFGMVKDSEPYKDAVQMAKSDPQVQALLGTPIEEGWIPVGNINVSGVGANQTGVADLSITLIGPNGEGTVDVQADEHGGQWTINSCMFYFPPTQASIDLLNNPNNASGTPQPSAP